MVEEAAGDFLWEEFRPVTAQFSFGSHTTRDLAVIQSISAKESAGPFTTEGSSVHEQPDTTRPPALARFAVEEPALTAEKSSVTTVPERGARTASRENQNVSAFLNDLIPSLPRLEQKQNEKGLSSDSFACPPDTAAQLVAELKRLLVTVSPIASLLIPPRGGKQASPVASDTKMSVSENHALTLSTLNQLLRNSRRTSIHVLPHSWKSWRRHRTTRFLLVTALATWSRAAAVVVRRIRQPIYPARQPLVQGDRARFAESWRKVQARFVDGPGGAVTEADQLLRDVMSARGYPVSDFEQRAADISVDHPLVLENYRAAHQIALRQTQGQASTEDLRQAMIHYRTLFDELVGEPEVAHAKAAS